MRTADLDYALPPNLIAQQPVEPRSHSRLLVYERATGETRHLRFDQLADVLDPSDLLVANDTRVLPVRVRAAGPPAVPSSCCCWSRSPMVTGPLWPGPMPGSRR